MESFLGNGRLEGFGPIYADTQNDNLLHANYITKAQTFKLENHDKCDKILEIMLVNDKQWMIDSLQRVAGVLWDGIRLEYALWRSFIGINNYSTAKAQGFTNSEFGLGITANSDSDDLRQYPPGTQSSPLPEFWETLTDSNTDCDHGSSGTETNCIYTKSVRISNRFCYTFQQPLNLLVDFYKAKRYKPIASEETQRGRERQRLREVQPQDNQPSFIYKPDENEILLRVKLQQPDSSVSGKTNVITCFFSDDCQHSLSIASQSLNPILADGLFTGPHYPTDSSWFQIHQKRFQVVLKHLQLDKRCVADQSWCIHFSNSWTNKVIVGDAYIVYDEDCRILNLNIQANAKNQFDTRYNDRNGCHVNQNSDEHTKESLFPARSTWHIGGPITSVMRSFQDRVENKMEDAKVRALRKVGELREEVARQYAQIVPVNVKQALNELDAKITATTEKFDEALSAGLESFQQVEQNFKEKAEAIAKAAAKESKEVAEKTLKVTSTTIRETASEMLVEIRKDTTSAIQRVLFGKPNYNTAKKDVGEKFNDEIKNNMARFKSTIVNLDDDDFNEIALENEAIIEVTI